MELTFINAFESSPVHCLYPRPSGKRRKWGNAGADAILNVLMRMCRYDPKFPNLPSVYICQDLLCQSFCVLFLDVGFNPLYQVVLECPFD